MSIGSGNSMNIRIKATALSMAATVRLWVVFFFMVISSPGRFAPNHRLESPFRMVRNREDNQKRALPQQTLQQGA